MTGFFTGHTFRIKASMKDALLLLLNVINAAGLLVMLLIMVRVMMAIHIHQ